MTTNNGWPGKPGWPLHRERDGWHIVQMGDLDPEFAFWRAKPWLEHAFGCWETKGFEGEFQPHEISNWSYLGPALTPDEAAALQARADQAALGHARLRAELANARCEGMEEAAKIADSCAADWAKSAKGKYLETKWDYESRADAADEIAAAIRAAAKEGKP